MAKAFLVCYSGSDRYGNKHTPYKAVVHTADDAIAVINTWKTYGKKDSTNEWEQIKVNALTEEKIREYFSTGTYTSFEGNKHDVLMVRTTGCGCWDITARPALADTLEEHERIFGEQREAAKRERIRQAQEAKEKRLEEMNEERRGWYHVELDLVAYVFNNKGNDYRETLTYSCTLIADSAMDAYDKTVKYLHEHPEEITVRGNIAALEACAKPESGHFEYTFLGVKTDEGYSVKLWEEWKKNGEI